MVGKKPPSGCTWKRYQREVPSNREVQAMFDEPDLTGLAVIHGRASGGLVVRDFDEADAYHQWAAEFPRLSRRLPTVRTRRGYHVYFLGPERYRKLPDGEYRGDVRHYTLVPPSLHPAGGRYEWVIPLANTIHTIHDPEESGLLNSYSSGCKPISLVGLEGGIGIGTIPYAVQSPRLEHFRS
jgi:hypothetical protein